ncbi:MAG: GDCCVxC domain-containing (seleno)protein [Chitinophagaceae bacterium]
MEDKIIFQSVITCPKCGHQKAEDMPEDACLYFYECTNCKAVLKPRQGDCCVFCSYGSAKCPPVQLTRRQ